VSRNELRGRHSVVGRLVLGTPLIGWLLVLLAAGLLTGCNYFKAAVLLFGEEQTKKVPAEYPQLADKKVCIVVWAEAYTLFEYPNVQLELSEHVRVAVEGAVHGVTFAPTRQVVDYQNRNPDWDKQQPASIGQRFDADRVIMIELTDYTTREPDSPHLKRGRISANVKVYDVSTPDAQPVYKTTLETLYPPGTVAAYGVDDRSVRRGAMQAFASQVAGKFHERQEKVHKENEPH
jgi:hypothetical protein